MDCSVGLAEGGMCRTFIPAIFYVLFCFALSPPHSLSRLSVICSLTQKTIPAVREFTQNGGLCGGIFKKKSLHLEVVCFRRTAVHILSLKYTFYLFTEIFGSTESERSNLGHSGG